ncbi:hypothetical protein [Agromyces aureus]|uniref:hypothetical protein n=1 Tax=Agromyces aureus TaxID=453304 RepID=UPI000A9AAF91|nr:hypothetical protein [Agromyces aureus]
MSTADIAFSAFLSTITPGRVKRERWQEPIAVTLARKYDHETERLRASIHTNTKEHAA